MSRTIVVVRPEPGNAETVSAAREMGLDAVALPVQEVVPVPWEVPEGDFDGLLVGSANVFRQGGEHLEHLRHLPVHAVGERTAGVALRHGFSIGTTGTGGLQSVLDRLDADRALRLLRVGGEERVSLQSPGHIEIVDRVVYRLAPCSLSNDAISILRAGPCVLFHSVGSMRVFHSECERVGVDISQIAVIALGPRIADAADAGWERVDVAARPNDMALLALARGICH